MRSPLPFKISLPLPQHYSTYCMPTLSSKYSGEKAKVYVPFSFPVCQILPKGVVSVIGPASSPASGSTVSHICGEKEVSLLYTVCTNIHLLD